MFTCRVAFALQVSTAFRSSTAPVCGAQIHEAAFTLWSTSFGLIESLAVALELKGWRSPLFDTFS